MARPPAAALPARGHGDVAMGGYWSAAPTIAGLMIIVIAVRLHEFVPKVQLLQPLLLTMSAGIALLFTKSGATARRAVLSHPLLKLGAAYLCFQVVTVPFAMWPKLAAETAWGFLPGVALVAGILFCAPHRRSVERIQLIMVVAAAAYAMYAKLFGRETVGDRLHAGGGMYDANDMAAILALSFPLALGLLRSERGRTRLIGAGTAALLVVVIIASGSRGGMLGLVAGAIVFVLGMKGSKRVTSLVLGSVIATLVWSTSPTVQKRMNTLTNLETDYNTFAEDGRKMVWKRGRGYFKEHPVVGVGAGNFPIAEGGWSMKALAGEERGFKWSNAHNSYIQAYAELGLIGGSLFVGLLLFGVHRSGRLYLGVRSPVRRLVHQPELLAGLCAFMVTGTFLSHAYFLPLMALLGLIGLADRAVQEERRQVHHGPPAALGGRIPAPLPQRSRPFDGPGRRPPAQPPGRRPPPTPVRPRPALPARGRS